MLGILFIGILIGILGTLVVIYILRKKDQPQELPEDFFDFFDFDEDLYDELDAIFDDKETSNGNQTN